MFVFRFDRLIGKGGWGMGTSYCLLLTMGLQRRIDCFGNNWCQAPKKNSQRQDMTITHDDGRQEMLLTLACIVYHRLLKRQFRDSLFSGAHSLPLDELVIVSQ